MRALQKCSESLKVDRKRKHLKIIAEVFFIVLALLWIITIMYPRLRLPLYEPDEAAWIYSGYYFNLYFLKGDLSHKDWLDYDAYDHPPLVKYIVGGALLMKGHVFDSLDAKKMWHSIPMDQYESNYRLLINKLPKNILPSIRFVLFIFASLAVVLVYIFVRYFYGVLSAIISTSLLITNFIFIELSTQILADPVLFFFFIFFIFFCGLFVKSGNHVYLFFLFVLSSFAFLTKLNGLVLIVILFFIVMMRNKFAIQNYNFKVLILGFMTFLLMTLLLNPFFLHAGVHGLIKMVEHRISHIHFQQETFKAEALLSLGERLKSEIVVIFFGFSVVARLVKFPLELMAFLLGIYYSVRKKDIVLITMLIFLIFLPLSVLPLNWKRYVYTVLPFIYIIAGVSVNVFKELEKKGIEKVARVENVGRE